ncbi:putative monovalent cation/H+ antiporter subunit A [Winogradskyella psychrotolerans]|uniref:putative monovalent cation/H+ antiporter subunit A n=1 Tax=Winogradskyella psychrotolerans TaxID=1344585 RepID=UPI001C078EB2|nr:putative monovalent cation/H+ antiporter subunit A [Winogradskyella psychrotolerans]MBU2927601.1 putative monovalent cation/H+ antiporter subunit A [Winogradskyella psychrotolerans]
MLIAILSGFLFSFFMVFVGKYMKGKLAFLSALIPLGLFIYFLQFAGRISNGEIISQTYAWVPSLGIDFGLTLDGLSLIFCLMITGIGFLVFAYTAAYLKGHHYLDRFYGYLGIFMAAMLGVVLSDNVISLFTFWELTSISSFFLIGFNNNEEASRKSAVLALAITGMGGLLLFAGVVILGNVVGTYSISEMLSSKEFIANSPQYTLIVALIFGAAFTKSAQFPFHFWLPGAMKAPTPVSTYLHSATMVKAGVYLLMRFTPILGSTEFWNSTLIIVGSITMLYAAIHTLFRTDLKGILAYSTISALGILVFLIGLGTEAALLAACVFILVHALYKATLFLITGIIDHETGTRDVTVLSGLRKVLFPVAIAGFLAAISNAGIPPSFGFLGKDLIYEATLHFGNSAILLTVLAIITNILLLYAGFLAGIKPFTGKLPHTFSKVHLPSFLMWTPPLILAILGILIGVFPSIIQGSLIQPAVNALGETGSAVELKLWHGFNTILALSATTIGIGLLFYFFIKPSVKIEAAIKKLEYLSPKTMIEGFGIAFGHFSKIWTTFFQNGFLRHYVSTIILFLVLVMGYTLINNTNYVLNFSSLTQLTIYEVITVIIMIGGILYTVFSKSRLAAVAAMGVVGLTISLIFVYYSAPDLAMTQFAIDTLTVILFVLVLYRLPKYLKLSNYKSRIKDGILSITFGTLITILALEVLNEPQNSEISEFYAANAYLLAKGKNVVNVILVDFRGIDTFMEITVLTIAAIGVFGLLKLRLTTKDRAIVKDKNKI